jgi:hypothetical protein
MVDINVEAKGIKETKEKFISIQKNLTGGPMTIAMGKATLLVTGLAKKNAPVDRGALRASITPDVQVSQTMVRGIVGSNLAYAPYQELGTRPFTPPMSPIWAWALRKSKGNFKKASRLFIKAMTSIRGRGIIPKRFLQRAFESSIPKIKRLIESAVKRIIK